MRRQWAVLSGEIDLASRETLSEVLSGISSECDSAVVDMRGVTYIDSTGLSALVALKRRLRAESATPTEVQLLIGSPLVYRLFITCGLDGMFTLTLSSQAKPGEESRQKGTHVSEEVTR